jgi:N-acetylmuramoyl-L-alanine amidase
MADPLHIEPRKAAVYRVPRPDWEVVNTIVLHDTAGSTVGGTLAHFDTLARQDRALGYHYLIGRKGEVLRLVEENERTSHASGANRGTIGIAFVGGNVFEGKISDKQINSAVALIADIKTRHPIENVLGHRHVKPSPFTNSPRIDPRILDRTIANIAERTELSFDRKGAATSELNRSIGARDASEALGCLIFPPLGTFVTDCNISLQRFLSTPKAEQRRMIQEWIKSQEKEVEGQ